MAFIVAILGAESTGKTVLAQSLGERLRDDAGRRVAVVSEYLREFCDALGRTPAQHEQASIAQQQTLRIAQAATNHDVVIADTTALMTAVYSEVVFGDRSLYSSAEADHRVCDLTLLTALDLPWLPDGLQRDGPHVREPVDSLVRAALRRAGAAYAVVSGSGDARTESALAAVSHALGIARGMALKLTPAQGPSSSAESDGLRRWTSCCERCGDAECERRCLPRFPAPPR